MALAGWKVVLLAVQIEDPLPFPSQQLMICVRRCISEHEAGLLINLSVAVL